MLRRQHAGMQVQYFASQMCKRWLSAAAADAPAASPAEHSEQRLSTVAVIGLPNAGKSTLVNRLIGLKIAGVSSKRNTTVNTQLGCFTVGNSQVLLYDTPGLVEHHVKGSPLERLRSSWATAAMADQLLLIVDAERQFRLREEAILKLTQQLSDGPPNSLASKWQCPPLLLFLNKQDKLPENIRAIAVQQVRQQLCKLADFQHVFEGAAMLGVGVQDLKQYLLSKARKGRWVMPPDQATTSSPGELAVEFVREKLFRRLNQELPYTLVIAAEAVRERAGTQGMLIVVSVTVKSQRIKGLVVGKAGSIIQDYVTLPTEAELSKLLQTPVKLLVTVKVSR